MFLGLKAMVPTPAGLSARAGTGINKLVLN